MATVHVIGAGLAGLGCALHLAEAGASVRLYEATSHAGGRCRSYYDPQLERWIDNGNHLVFSGNHAVADHLRKIGVDDGMIDPGEAVFPFLDLATGRRWALRLNEGRMPWWAFDAARRIPDTGLGDYLALLRFAWAKKSQTVRDIVDSTHPLFASLIEPIAVAVLNASAQDGAARLLWPVLVESFGRGGRACHPMIARQGLSMSLVDPAVRRLGELGVPVSFTHRLREFEFRGHTVVGLSFIGGDVPLAGDDAVVLAVPHRVANLLVPELITPEGSRSIVNAHYRLPAPVALRDGLHFLAVLNGTAHWLFFRDDVVSATVSAAEALVDLPAEEIAARIWADVARAVAVPAEPMPPYRIVKEKTATFAQTPAELARRPAAQSAYANLFLAGDWTDTGLPATIEGALRSGKAAASLVLAQQSFAGVLRLAS
ncbi:MAG: hydroxysqualene dehydroxylase HpnE [Dongiaceae bacterium]